jgi:hypothetical protein
MTDRAKKITELTACTTPASTDLLIIETDPSGTPATKKITVLNVLNSGFINAASITGIRGPYATDAAANTANVAIGKLYYNADGTVKIRLT